MRLLCVFFLIMAFAQPIIYNGTEKNSIQTISVYVDNSLSMNTSNGNTTPLNESLVALEKMASMLDINTKYFFIDNNFSSKDKLQLNRDRFKDRLTETKPSITSKTLGEVLKKINVSANQSSLNKNNINIIISDFQKSNVGNLAKLNLDSTQKILLVPMQNTEIGNVYIDTLWVENLFNAEKTKNTLHYVIKNSGKKNIETSIRFYIEGTQNANTSVVLGANQKKELFFDFITRDRNEKKCKLILKNDAILFDNEYFFMINASPLIKILSIGANSNTYIHNVFQSESIFQYKENKLGELSAKDLASSDITFINSFDKLNLSEQNQLLAYVQKGGNLVLFPSPAVSSATLYNICKKFDLGDNLLINNVLEVENKSNLIAPDANNPFYDQVFDKIDKSITMPYVFPVLKLNSKNNILLSNTKDEPFLTHKQISNGKIYLFSTPIQSLYTDFFIHSIFVPTMYKLAFLSNSKPSKLAYTSEEKNIKLQIFLTYSQSKVTLVNEKFSYIPEQFFRSDGFVFKMPNQSIEAGYYKLIHADTTLTTLAINPSKSESIFDFYSVSELKNVFENFKNIKVFDLNTSLSVGEYLKNQYQGIVLWKYCMILALVSIFIEIMLIKYMK